MDLRCLVMAAVFLSGVSPAAAGGGFLVCASGEPTQESQVEAATLVIVVEGMMKSRSGAT